MSNFPKILIPILLIGLLSRPVRADHVILTSGKKITGIITKENEKTIQIESLGSKMTLPRNRIKEIVREGTEQNTRRLIIRAYDKNNLFEAYRLSFNFLKKNPDDDEIKKINNQCDGRLKDLVDRAVEKSMNGRENTSTIKQIEDWMLELDSSSPLYSFYLNRYKTLARTEIEHQLRFGISNINQILDKFERHSDDREMIAMLRARAYIGQRELEKAKTVLKIRFVKPDHQSQRKALLILIGLRENNFRTVAELAPQINPAEIEQLEIRREILQRLPTAFRLASEMAFKEGNYIDAKKYFASYLKYVDAGLAKEEMAVAFYEKVGDDRKMREHQIELDRERSREELRKMIANNKSAGNAKLEQEVKIVNDLDLACRLALTSNRGVLLCFVRKNMIETMQLQGYFEDIRARRAISPWFVVCVLDYDDEKSKALIKEYKAKSPPAIMMLNYNKTLAANVDFKAPFYKFLSHYEVILNKVIKVSDEKKEED